MGPDIQSTRYESLKATGLSYGDDRKPTVLPMPEGLSEPS